MNKVSLTLETITPLFLSGNDQNSVEFRAPSIRGQLRYWYRALLGGILTPYYPRQEDLAREVYEREKEIFGTTDQGSRVFVRAREIPPSNVTSFSFDGKFIRYLGYGLENRKAFGPGQRLEIEISLRESVDQLESIIAATLWATLQLGNFGARCHRGFGSLVPIDQVSLGGLVVKRTNSFDELTEQLKTNFKLVSGILEKYTNRTYRDPARLPMFSVICPQYWKLVILKDPYDSWQNALNFIGEALRTFREDRSIGQHSRKTSSGKMFSYYVSKDYYAVKNFFGGNPTTPKGSIFGLPHQFQFSSTGDKVMIKGQANIDRRASPLYIRIFRVGQKYYVGVQIFKSRFLPSDLEFEDLNQNSHRANVAAPNYQALDEFIAGLKNATELNVWGR